jgi:hypothetical protein
VLCGSCLGWFMLCAVPHPVSHDLNTVDEKKIARAVIHEVRHLWATGTSTATSTATTAISTGDSTSDGDSSARSNMSLDSTMSVDTNK